uniref:hypothetical protein n=1 Tax=unclassified Streptomyces TaxID=2593676 RepID=UPI003F495CC4
MNSIDPTTGESEGEQVLSTAKDLLSSRLDKIRPLAAVLSDRKRLQQQLDEIEKSYSTAYRDAISAGWTPEELKKLGAEEPSMRLPGRPKGSRTQKRRSPSAGSTTSGQSDKDGGQS